jgi:hypothetical protein
MDQRKVNMLAREYCDAAEPKIKFKPIILSHRASRAPRAPARIPPRARALQVAEEQPNTFSLQP